MISMRETQNRENLSAGQSGKMITVIMWKMKKISENSKNEQLYQEWNHHSRKIAKKKFCNIKNCKFSRTKCPSCAFWTIRNEGFSQHFFVPKNYLVIPPTFCLCWKRKKNFKKANKKTQKEKIQKNLQNHIKNRTKKKSKKLRKCFKKIKRSGITICEMFVQQHPPPASRGRKKIRNVKISFQHQLHLKIQLKQFN